MTQEQIIDILNNSQKEFKGINEANLDSADILKFLFEKQKLEFAISLLLKLRAEPTSVIDDKIIELEQQLEQL